MLFALVLAPVLALVSSGSALAEEAQRWAINMPKGVTPVSNAIYDIHMIIFLGSVWLFVSGFLVSCFIACMLTENHVVPLLQTFMKTQLLKWYGQ